MHRLWRSAGGSVVVLSAVAMVAGQTPSTPFVAQPVVPGGQIVALFPPASRYLKKDRLGEPSRTTCRRPSPAGSRASSTSTIRRSKSTSSIPSNNTGAAVIVVPGGGHRTLNVGTEGADFVPFFYNYGVATIILRNRLRQDGYVAETDAVYDAQQAVRVVRARAKEWNIDSAKDRDDGVLGRSRAGRAGGVVVRQVRRGEPGEADGAAGASSRPDFVALIYPGPTPFAREPKPAVPRNTPPAFIATAGSGDAVHAVWADEFFAALLKARIPNLEMHVYGSGVHGNGLKDRTGTPFGWQYRFIDWVRLAFLGSPAKRRRRRKRRPRSWPRR